MKTNRLALWGMSLLAVAAIGSAYFIGRARAAGVPTTTPLTYSGTLTDTSGVALAGSKNLQVQLWNMATAGNVVCTTGSAAQTLVNGSFSIALPDSCVAAVHTTQDLWAEILVDGASTGRTKIGAVPYALEADTASNAVGALASKLATIPSIQLNSSGYVNCQPITNFATAGFNNLLVRAQIFSDATCATEVTSTSCHPWCAALEMRQGTAFNGNCCGVATYYTGGVIDVLQWK